MKKAFPLVLIIIMVCLLCVGVSACNNNGGEGELDYVKPVKWEYYWDKAAQSLAQNAAINGNAISIKVQGSAEISDKSVSVIIAINYDLVNLQNSALVIEFKEIGTNTLLFSIKSDNSCTYIDIAPNKYLDDAKLKVENVRLFDWLKTKYDKTNSNAAVATLKDIIYKFGEAVFGSVDISADNSRYTFEIDSKRAASEISTRYFDALTTLLDDGTLMMLLNAFGVDSKQDLVGQMPALSGSISLDMIGDEVVGINTDEVVIGSETLACELDIEVKNSLIDDLKSQYFPASDTGYKQTKLSTTQVKGTLALNTSNGNKRAISYDYELNINMDLFELALNGYDLSTLSDDNFFHFRLSHTCNDYCTEFCRSKMGWERSPSQGAILDVAFAPKDFDNSNLYINFNLKNTMSKRLFDRLNNNGGLVNINNFPQYCNITIAPESYDEQSPLQVVFARINALFASADTGFELSTDELLSAFANDAFAYDYLSDFFVSEEYHNDILQFKIESKKDGEALDYDIYKQTIFIIDNNISASKSYGNQSYTAVEWRPESAKMSNLMIELNNIYDEYGNLIHGVDADGGYVPMSDYEAHGLVGGYINIEYKDLHYQYNLENGQAQLRDYMAEIVEVSGLDLTSRNPQKISLVVRYPNPFDFSIMAAIFGDYRDMFTSEVDVFVMLTPEQEFVFEQQDYSNTSFRMTEANASSTSPPEFLQAQVRIIYEGYEYEKVLNVIGKSDAVIITRGLFTTIRYSVADYGEITATFDVANRSMSRNYYVEAPDRIELKLSNNAIYGVVDNAIPFSTLTSKVYLIAYYGEDSVKLTMSMGDYYINDIPLDKSTSDWTVGSVDYPLEFDTIRFSKTNTYKVVIKKANYVSEPFDLVITAAQSVAPEYSYKPTSEPSSCVVNTQLRFSGNIVNEQHGESTNTLKTFSVKAYKGTVSGDRITYTSIPMDGITAKINLQASSVDNAKDFPYQHNIPSLILNTQPMHVYFTFTQAGIYKMEVRMTGGTSRDMVVTWEIEVK